MLASVIIPTYNRASTIERALDSVFAQSWKPMEVIVVDSNSTDKTAEALATYGDKIHLIQRPKQGPGAARNAGIKAAKGDIITFLDSDDEWLPGKLERQVKLLQATESLGVKCCVTNARWEFKNRTVTAFGLACLRPGLREGVWTNPAEVLTTRFLFFNQVVAVRREAFDQIGYFREDIHSNEDYDIALRLSVLGPWAFITDPLVEAHLHADNGIWKVSALECCQDVLQILKDLGNSPQFGPLLPATLLRRRIRGLEQEIRALSLSARSNALAGLLGKFLRLYLHGCDAVCWRLPSTPRMVTRPL